MHATYALDLKLDIFCSHSAKTIITYWTINYSCVPHFGRTNMHDYIRTTLCATGYQCFCGYVCQ